MLNFDFLEKGQEIVSPHHFVYDFSRKIFYELSFIHIFETQIHVQTQIRKSFILALATNDFL